MNLRVLGCAALLISCASSSEPQDEKAADGRRVVELEEAPMGRAVVATVAGVPVYDDCVRNQMAERSIDAAAAVRECIDFELLSQEALRRGVDASAIEAVRKRESVRVLLERDFEPTADEPSDIPAEWVQRKVWSRREVQMGYNHPEYRVAAYALSKYELVGGNKKILTPENDAKAKALAEEWYEAIKDRKSLDHQTLYEIVSEVSGDRKFDFHHGYNTTRKGRSVEEFASALFGLERVGDFTGVVRSDYGYFVILLTNIIPAKSESFEEALPAIREQVFEKWRSVAFIEFIRKLSDQRKIEVFDERLGEVKADIPSEFSVIK